MATIDGPFVRALTTAVVEHSLVKSAKPVTVNERNLKAGTILLQRYIETKDDLEMECLFAIQLLMNKLEHPYGRKNYTCY